MMKPNSCRLARIQDGRLRVWPNKSFTKTNGNWQNNYIKVAFVDLKSFKTNLKRFLRYLDNF